MAKKVSNDVLDAALDKIATATTYTLCDGEPADYSDISAHALGDTTISGSDFGSPADGDVSGRKIQVNAQSGINIDSGGTADHVALDDGATLLYVTTLDSSQAVTSGNTADLGAWDVEIEDPS